MKSSGRSFIVPMLAGALLVLSAILTLCWVRWAEREGAGPPEIRSAEEQVEWKSPAVSRQARDFVTVVATVREARKLIEQDSSGAGLESPDADANVARAVDSQRKVLEDSVIGGQVDEAKGYLVVESLKTMSHSGYLTGSVWDNVQCSTVACAVTFRSESRSAQSTIAYNLVSQFDGRLGPPTLFYDLDNLVTKVYLSPKMGSDSAEPGATF